MITPFDDLIKLAFFLGAYFGTKSIIEGTFKPNTSTTEVIVFALMTSGISFLAAFFCIPVPVSDALYLAFIAFVSSAFSALITLDGLRKSYR